ncbi:MAG: hypothetical protein ACXVCY_12275 [Pseudobdellovibrionaceae bacterium]
MKLAIYLLIGLISSGASAADTQRIDVPVPPARFYKDAHGYHVAANDGREMTIYEYIREPKQIQIKLRQIENTCIPDQELADCIFNLDLAPFHYFFVWTKHTDPSKVGTFVNFETAKVSSILSYYEIFKNEDFNSMFKPDRLSCSNYNWTEGLPKTKTNSIIIDSWSNEAMFPNAETKVNENQTQNAAFDIELQPNKDNQFEVVNVKAEYQPNPFVFFAPYLSTQVSNLNFKSTSGQTCQVSFESSLGESARSTIGSPYFSEIDLKNSHPVTNILAPLYMQLRPLIQAQLANLFANGGVK